MATKERTGIVVSAKMIKTCIVLVRDRVFHERYKKIITRSKRYAAHASKCDAKEGDTVQISATKQISKTKSWEITEIIPNGEKVECVGIEDTNEEIKELLKG